MLAHGRVLTGADASWWHMEEPSNQMAVTAVLVVDAPLDVDRLRDLLQRRLLAFDRFRERVVEPPLRLGRPRWVDAGTIRLDDHVRSERLPEPGGQPALQALVSREMSRPLDPRRPLWRMVHVPDYRGGAAIVARVHHCIADGLALIHLLLELDDAAPGGVGTYWGPPASAPAGDRLPGSRHARSIGGAIALGARTAGSLGHLAGMRPDPLSPLRCGLTGEKHAAWSAPIDLGQLRHTAHAAGATLNDLLVACVAGGVLRILDAHGAELRRAIRAVIPVNLRCAEAPSSLGNRFGLVFAPLPVRARDPHQRIGEVRQTMQALKLSPEAGVVLGLLEFFGRTPRTALDAAVALLGRKASLVFTNVPGPRRRIRFCGTELIELVGWVPASGRLGLGVSALSYGDELRFGIAADAGLQLDPRDLAQACEREAAEFLDPAVFAGAC